MTTVIVIAALSLLVAVIATVVIRRRSRARHRVSGVKAVLASVAGLGAGIVIAVSGAGATYAYLNAQATVPGAQLSSGSLGVSVSPSSIASTTWTGLLPGETARQTVTITSTGHAASTLRMTLSAATPLEVRVATGACTATVLTTAPLTTTTPTSLGDFAEGQSRTFCLQVGVPATGAAEGATYAFSLVVDSTQRAL